LPFLILAIVFSVLRSFCLFLFWPLYCLCFDPFAFLYFGHCIVCVAIYYFWLSLLVSSTNYKMKNKKGHCGSTSKIQYLNLRKRQTHKNITPHIPDLV
jgi:cellulose synthase/poly-beta-1,6-N-acetylglucosamine synthase-like glycosyltransferase